MINEPSTTTPRCSADDLIQSDSPYVFPPSGSQPNGGISQAPIIEVSESDGTFQIYADFRPALQGAKTDIEVEFARQGMILTSGKVQRYLPLPTDAQTDHARVAIADGIVRVSIQTADLGHRWRSIVMW